MAGYTPDEKLRLQQLRALRRRWLKDQELSPREPVLPPPKLGPVDRFWKRFLQPGSFWRLQVSEARVPQPCPAEAFPPRGSLDHRGP
uniref:NADH dehydrogenase [ubiquinone] 1 beta subcomplex subunit 6 n=2 Tax=Terrapene triunguis TaxID=2587831 RepID=A0A674J1H3_9SAUR